MNKFLLGKHSWELLQKKRVDALIISVGIVLGFLTPGTVTWDGYLYEGSAFSLFSKNMIYNYHWLREPGFPALFRFFYNNGGFHSFVLCQSILLTLSIIFFRYSLLAVFPIPTKSLKYLNAACIFSLWIGMEYAASVLQQILFIFFISIISYVGTRNLSRKRIITLGALIGMGVALTSALLFIGVISGLVTIAFLSKLLTRQKWKAWLLLGTIFCAGGLTTSSWYIYKSTQNQNLRIYKDAWNFWEAATCRENLTGSKSKLVNGLETIFEIPSTIASINSMGVEYCQGTLAPVGGEEITFASPRFPTNQTCGRTFPGPQKYLSLVHPNVKMYCVPKPIIKITNYLHVILAGLIPIIGWTGFISMILASRRKILWEMGGFLLLPLLCEIPYWSSSGAGSRYGIQMLIFSPMLTISLYLSYKDRKQKFSWIRASQ